jgi:hypothetical protein
VQLSKGRRDEEGIVVLSSATIPMHAKQKKQGALHPHAFKAVKHAPF